MKREIFVNSSEELKQYVDSSNIEKTIYLEIVLVIISREQCIYKELYDMFCPERDISRMIR